MTEEPPQGDLSESEDNYPEIERYLTETELSDLMANRDLSPEELAERIMNLRLEKGIAISTIDARWGIFSDDSAREYREWDKRQAERLLMSSAIPIETESVAYDLGSIIEYEYSATETERRKLSEALRAVSRSWHLPESVMADFFGDRILIQPSGPTSQVLGNWRSNDEGVTLTITEHALKDCNEEQLCYVIAHELAHGVGEMAIMPDDPAMKSGEINQHVLMYLRHQGSHLLESPFFANRIKKDLDNNLDDNELIEKYGAEIYTERLRVYMESGGGTIEDYISKRYSGDQMEEYLSVKVGIGLNDKEVFYDCVRERYGIDLENVATPMAVLESLGTEGGPLEELWQDAKYWYDHFHSILPQDHLAWTQWFRSKQIDYLAGENIVAFEDDWDMDDWGDYSNYSYDTGSEANVAGDSSHKTRKSIWDSLFSLLMPKNDSVLPDK